MKYTFFALIFISFLSNAQLSLIPTHIDKKVASLNLDDLFNKEKKKKEEEKKRIEIESAERQKNFQKRMDEQAQECANINNLTEGQRLNISREYFIAYSSINLLQVNNSLFGCQFVVDTPKGVKKIYFNKFSGGINELLSD